MLLPSFGRFDWANFGTLMSRSGVGTTRPRKAGRLPGTLVGLPESARLTPVWGASEGVTADINDMLKPHAHHSKDSFPPTFNTVRRHVIATNLLAAYMRVSCARLMRMDVCVCVRLKISHPHPPPGCVLPLCQN